MTIGAVMYAVPQNQQAQAVLRRRGECVKAVSRRQERLQHRQRRARFVLRQPSPQSHGVLTVKARPPHQGHQLGMRVTGCGQQGRAMRTYLLDQVMNRS
jgi:hypothetical protein